MLDIERVGRHQHVAQPEIFVAGKRVVEAENGHLAVDVIDHAGQGHRRCTVGVQRSHYYQRHREQRDAQCRIRGHGAFALRQQAPQMPVHGGRRRAGEELRQRHAVRGQHRVERCGQLRVAARGGIAGGRAKAILRQREQVGQRRRCGRGIWKSAGVEHGEG